jgi:hypothetical protein
MLAAQDGAEAAGHEAVDDLHALEVARFLHHLWPFGSEVNTPSTPL